MPTVKGWAILDIEERVMAFEEGDYPYGTEPPRGLDGTTYRDREYNNYPVEVGYRLVEATLSWEG